MSKSSFFTAADEILFENRLVQITGPVTSELAYNINRQLLAMERKDAKKPIHIFIDSPGGSVDSGFSIYDTARLIGPEVYTIVAGLAASMGSLIALCAKKENRFAFPNAKLLIHQPLISGTLQGSASELEIHAQDIIKTKERINRLYAKETGRTYEQVCEATDRDRWFTAEEAMKFGLIHKIIDKRSDIPGF